MSTMRQVARIESAFSTEFEQPHSHFVATPVRPGPQPCLIELQQLDGSVRLTDAVTILPTSAQWLAVTDPVYAAYLDLIAREYANDLSKSAADPEITALALKTPDDPPFQCAAISALRQSIFAAIEQDEFASTLDRKDANALRECMSDLVHQTTKASLWHPKHLDVGRTAQKWTKAWAILARWDDWELRKLDWTGRLKQHAQDVGKQIRRKSQERDALRKLCTSIGLVKGSLSPAKRLLSACSLPERKILC